MLDYNAVGLSVTGHPMERWRDWCRKRRMLDSRDLVECRHGERVVVAGLVIVRQRPQTAKGTIFLLLEDERGVMNVIVPRRLVERYDEIVRHATFVVAYGRVERDEDEISVAGERFEAMAETEVVHPSHDFR